MSFKQFLMEQYNMDMATYKRKPEEVQASISEEFARFSIEDKSSTAHYRKVNHARRDRQRKSERAAKSKRMELFTEVFDEEDE